MKRKIILTKKNKHILMTIIENDEIVEINCCKEESAKQHLVGNIYVGKVKKIVSNINAAFIEIEKGVECYYSMEDKKVRVGEELLVEIKKEAAKGKAATVTTKWSLQGRYVVLSVGDNKLGISKKMSKDKRNLLSALAKEHVTEQYGLIIRTNAQHAKWEDVEQELELLVTQYEQLVSIADKRVCYSCIYRQPAEYLSTIRSARQEGLEEIVVEDVKLYEEVFQYLETYMPNEVSLLKRYEDSLLSLHKLHSVDYVLEECFKERVWMKSGAYLMIQQTEACTVIDVNTGKAIRRKDESLSINLEAAKEVARQIRLRNLSGIILVDFINLVDADSIRQLLHTLEQFLKCDPVSTTLVDMTKLQLVEITRKKIRKPLAESFCE